MLDSTSPPSSNEHTPIAVGSRLNGWPPLRACFSRTRRTSLYRTPSSLSPSSPSLTPFHPLILLTAEKSNGERISYLVGPVCTEQSVSRGTTVSFVYPPHSDAVTRMDSVLPVAKDTGGKYVIPLRNLVATKSRPRTTLSVPSLSVATAWTVGGLTAC
jgi:hypothetical protein